MKSTTTPTLLERASEALELAAAFYQEAQKDVLKDGMLYSELAKSTEEAKRLSAALIRAKESIPSLLVDLDHIATASTNLECDIGDLREKLISWF